MLLSVAKAMRMRIPSTNLSSSSSSSTPELLEADEIGRKIFFVGIESHDPKQGEIGYVEYGDTARVAGKIMWLLPKQKVHRSQIHLYNKSEASVEMSAPKRHTSFFVPGPENSGEIYSTPLPSDVETLIDSAMETLFPALLQLSPDINTFKANLNAARTTFDTTITKITNSIDDVQFQELKTAAPRKRNRTTKRKYRR